MSGGGFKGWALVSVMVVVLLGVIVVMVQTVNSMVQRSSDEPVGQTIAPVKAVQADAVITPTNVDDADETRLPSEEMMAAFVVGETNLPTTPTGGELDINDVDVLEEDKSYVGQLSQQMSHKAADSKVLSDAELDKLFNKKTGPVTVPKKSVDTYNKVHIEPTKKPDYDEYAMLSALVSASLVQHSDPKAVSIVVKKETSSFVASLVKEVAVRKSETRTYVVKQDDSLSMIAFKIYGSYQKYRKIARANPSIITNPNKIHVGMVLRIPD